MKREVFFVVNENVPKLDGEGKWVPAVEIRLRFDVCFVGRFSATMRVDFVEKWFDSQCLDTQRCIHTERVHFNNNHEDFLLAAACEGAGAQVAQEAAMNLFWRHVVLPSVEASGEHWLRKHAPDYWSFVADIILKERERKCAEVQDV